MEKGHIENKHIRAASNIKNMKNTLKKCCFEWLLDYKNTEHFRWISSADQETLKRGLKWIKIKNCIQPSSGWMKNLFLFQHIGVVVAFLPPRCSGVTPDGQPLSFFLQDTHEYLNICSITRKLTKTQCVSGSWVNCTTANSGFYL